MEGGASMPINSNPAVNSTDKRMTTEKKLIKIHFMVLPPPYGVSHPLEYEVGRGVTVVLLMFNATPFSSTSIRTWSPARTARMASTLATARRMC